MIKSLVAALFIVSLLIVPSLIHSQEEKTNIEIEIITPDPIQIEKKMNPLMN